MSGNAASIMGLEDSGQLSLALFIHGSECVNDSETMNASLPLLNISDALSLQLSSAASFMRDDSMLELGIRESDLLLIDRKLKPQHGDIVLYRLQGELSCRQLDMKAGCLHKGDGLEVLCLKDQVDLVIEGVVRHIIHSLR